MVEILVRSPAGLLVLSVLATGCTSVAQVTTLSDPACHQALVDGVASILVEQKEDPQLAGRLANQTAQGLEAGELGPRPFLVPSPSGAAYSFFVQDKRSGCLLRLYGRAKGFTSYTNNLNYIATRPLAPCQCAE